MSDTNEILVEIKWKKDKKRGERERERERAGIEA